MSCENGWRNEGLVPGRDLNELDAKVEELRKQHPGISYKEIAEELGETPSHIHRRVRVLIRENRIEARGGPGFRGKGGEGFRSRRGEE